MNKNIIRDMNKNINKDINKEREIKPSETRLIEQKLLTLTQLEAAKAFSKKQNCSVMEAIIELGYAKADEILMAFGNKHITITPKRIKTAVVKKFFDGDKQPYWVAHNPEKGGFLMVSEQQKFIWDQLDGTHSILNITLAFTRKFRISGTQIMNNFIDKLGKMGFIEGVPAEEKNKSVVPWWKRVVKTFLWKKFPIKTIDKTIVRFYNLFGTFIWHPVIKIAAFLTVISGVILFIWQIIHRSAVITSPSEINLWVFGLLNVIVYLLCLALHELGHAVVCKHHGLTIPDGGMALYLGLPCFYVSTVNSWLSPPSVRITISLAGSYVNLILAGIFIPLSFIPGAAGDFFFLMTLLNYMTILINLNPLGRFDGYYIAMDVMGIPALKSRLWLKTREALTAVIKGKWGVIPRTSKLTLLYILIGTVYTVGLISLVIFLNWM